MRIRKIRKIELRTAQGSVRLPGVSKRVIGERETGLDAFERCEKKLWGAGAEKAPL